MSEVIVVNLFLWVMVFLVGGIFFKFPRITRKGWLFGVYVGEEFADGAEARQAGIATATLQVGSPNRSEVRRERDSRRFLWSLAWWRPWKRSYTRY